MQAVFAFGVDGPRGFDGEPRADEGGSQGVPRGHLFVGEHHGEAAVVTQDAVHLAERRGHLALVVGLRQIAFLAAQAGEARRVSDRLVVLVGQFVAEEVGEEVADAALEPDVEEVGKLGVLDVVVVGWVHGDV